MQPLGGRQVPIMRDAGMCAWRPDLVWAGQSKNWKNPSDIRKLPWLFLGCQHRCRWGDIIRCWNADVSRTRQWNFRLVCNNSIQIPKELQKRQRFLDLPEKVTTENYSTWQWMELIRVGCQTFDWQKTQTLHQTEEDFCREKIRLAGEVHAGNVVQGNPAVSSGCWMSVSEVENEK